MIRSTLWQLWHLRSLEPAKGAIARASASAGLRMFLQSTAQGLRLSPELPRLGQLRQRNQIEWSAPCLDPSSCQGPCTKRKDCRPCSMLQLCVLRIRTSQFDRWRMIAYRPSRIWQNSAMKGGEVWTLPVFELENWPQLTNSQSQSSKSAAAWATRDPNTIHDGLT